MNIYRDAVVYDAKEHHYDARVDASQSIHACMNIEVAFLTYAICN